MKIFLLTSVMAMLAAGIYGTVDLMLDIKNGTLIRYEEDEPVTMKRFIAKKMQEIKPARLHVAQKKEVVKPPPLNDFPVLDFSRGEPPMIYETLLLEKAGMPDSLKNAGVASALEDSVIVPREIVIEDTLQKPAVKKPVEAKRLARLFSRSKPRYYPKEIPVDSVNTDKIPN